MVRRQVLQLFKDLMKAAYQIEDQYYRMDIVKWIRRDFQTNKGLKDEV